MVDKHKLTDTSLEFSFLHAQTLTAESVTDFSRDRPIDLMTLEQKQHPSLCAKAVLHHNAKYLDSLNEPTRNLTEWLVTQTECQIF
jgi:hypothetical protein